MSNGIFYKLYEFQAFSQFVIGKVWRNESPTMFKAFSSHCNDHFVTLIEYMYLTMRNVEGQGGCTIFRRLLTSVDPSLLTCRCILRSTGQNCELQTLWGLGLSYSSNESAFHGALYKMGAISRRANGPGDKWRIRLGVGPEVREKLPWPALVRLVPEYGAVPREGGFVQPAAAKTLHVICARVTS